jgi:hypothetical protein
MPSKLRDTKENQIKLYDQRMQERRADLEKKGMTPKEFTKDNVYEHLKAKRRAIMKAIAAIDASNARNVHPVKADPEPPAPAPDAPKEKKPKKEKSAKAAPAKAGK